LPILESYPDLLVGVQPTYALSQKPSFLRAKTVVPNVLISGAPIKTGKE